MTPLRFSCQDVDELTGALALSAVDADEARAAREHLSSCPEPHAELRSMLGADAVLAAGLAAEAERRHRSLAPPRAGPTGSGIGQAQAVAQLGECQPQGPVVRDPVVRNIRPMVPDKASSTACRCSSGSDSMARRSSAPTLGGGFQVEFGPVRSSDCSSASTTSVCGSGTRSRSAMRGCRSDRRRPGSQAAARRIEAIDSSATPPRMHRAPGPPQAPGPTRRGRHPPSRPRHGVV